MKHALKLSAIFTAALSAAMIGSVAPAAAASFNVANDGADSATCGAETSPCRPATPLARPRRVRIRQEDLDAFLEASSAQMGPSEDKARGDFAAAREAVDAATTNPELATALRRLATAATKLARALPRQ